METKIITDAQLSDIMNRYIRGDSLYDIAQQTAIPYPTVLASLQNIYEALKKTVPFSFNDAAILQLSKLDKTESEAWKSWELSKRPKQKKTSKATKLGTPPADTESSDTKPNKMEQQINTEEREGTAAYLNIVLLCIKTRMDLLRLK